jgi:phosphatidylinositol alpha-1,6-mannosyltransferase
MVRHILLTNDFPPKVGGIQSYLWELWRRLPPDEVTVLTASYPGAEWWDRQQDFRIVRTWEPVLLPQPHLARRTRELAQRFGAEAVVIDPALPLGLIGPSLGLPYALVLHGAEVTVPGRLPVSRQLLARALRNASLLISAGTYPEAEALRAMRHGQEEGEPPSGAGARFRSAVRSRAKGRATTGEAVPEAPSPPSVQIPPGVDIERFRPLAHIDRAAARARLGLAVTAPLVASVSRLVPRKGMDTLIEAASSISGRFPGLSVAIAGAGRDRHRLEKLASRSDARVDFLGKLGDADLEAFYGCADVFALCCRSRWWGLEQEGFGIVLIEAAAAGTPCVTINSGGAGEAVIDGETGIVVNDETEGTGTARARQARQKAVQVARVADALGSVLADPAMARRMGEAGRRRAEGELSYDILAQKLAVALDGLAVAPLGPPSPGE